MMISDRDLDARLADAADIHDEDLPVLPESFLDELRADDTARSELRADDTARSELLADDAARSELRADDAARGEREPASVVAARQLVADAQRDRSAPRGRPRSRRPARRSIAALAGAALGVGVLVVGLTQIGTRSAPDLTARPTATSPAAADPTGPPDDLGPLEAPPGGLALAATNEISFPYSLDSEPTGLTPVLGMGGGLTLFGYTSPVMWTATYRSADDPGFGFRVSPGDPRILPPGSFENIDAEVTESTVTVGGVTGDLVRGDYNSPSCRYAPATPEQDEQPDELCAESFAELTWQRPDGLWVQVHGENDWSSAAAVVAVGESIVDRPQAVPLQVRLAPAGWSVSSYEDNTSLALISDVDPTIDNRISVSLQERWRGHTVPHLYEATTVGNPVEQVTINGQAGELVSVPNGSSEAPNAARMWIMEYLLPDGPVVYFTAPDILTRDQVLQIAGQVVYTS